MSVHILHVTDSFAPEHGGVERVVEQLASRQARRGLRVTVLTKAVKDAPLRERREDGVEVIRYPYFARPTLLAYFSSYFSGLRLSRELLRKTPPDLVHYHLTLSAQGPMRGLPDRVPSVYTFYGPWHHEYAVEAEDLRAKSSMCYRVYLRWLMRWQRRRQQRLLNKARKVVALSEFSRQWIAQLAPHRTFGVEVIPGGIDSQRFSPSEDKSAVREKLGISPGDFLVLTVRRLVRRMGIDLLLKGVSEAGKNGAPIQCLIGGAGPLQGELQDLAQALGVAANVRFLGYVPEDQLADLYRAADLFFVPTVAEENFGLILLEAAACGVPIASTPVGSLPELMRKIGSGLLAEDVSAQAIAEVITKAVANKEELQREAINVIAPRVRQEFDWDKIVERTAAVYRELGVG